MIRRDGDVIVKVSGSRLPAPPVLVGRPGAGVSGRVRGQMVERQGFGWQDQPWGGIATHVFERQGDGSLKIKLHTFNLTSIYRPLGKYYRAVSA